MRKVASAIALVGLAAIVWALWPGGSEGGDGRGDSSAPAGSSRATSVAAPTARRVFEGPAPDSQTPGLERSATAADGQVEVRITAQGKPRAGAQVRLYWRGAMDPNTNAIDWRLAGSGATGSDGVLRLPARPGVYLVAARAAGLAPARRDLVRPAGEPLTRVDLTLVPGVSLRARTVAKKTGEPVPLTEIRLTADARPGGGVRPTAPAEEQIFATSDGRGLARVDGLAPGRYRVEARSVGFARWAQDDVVVPSAGELAIDLESAGVLEGFVVDANGRPASGATVVAIGDEEPVTVTTGDGGGFSAEVVSGTYQLIARRGKETAALQRPLVVPGGTTVRGLRLVLAAAGALEGRVVAASNGAPVAGAAIAVSPYLKAGDTGRAVSGADGSYVVEDLPPGSYDVVVTAQGYAELSRRGITLTAGQRFPLELKLRGTGAVEGVVRDAAGQPAEGVAVREGLRWSGGSLTGFPAEARTDASGHYRLAGLNPGRARLVARREGDAPASATQEVEIREDQTAHADFALVDSGIVEGRVTAKGGGPPANATRILAFPQARGWGPGRTLDTEAAPDGSFRLELPPGAYTLSAFPKDFRRWRTSSGQRVSTTVEAGQTARVELSLADDDSGRTLTGQVLEPDGTPSPGAEVAVGGMGGRAFATTDAEGRFSIPVDADSFGRTLRVTAENGGRKGDAAVQPDQDEVEVRLRASAVVRGHVVSADGEPVTGFTLQIGRGFQFSDQNQGREFAGDRFELYDVPTGDVRLVVRTNDGRRGQVQATVTDADTVVDITVQQGASVSGRLMDAASRQPLSEGFVSIVSYGSGGGREGTRVGPDGAFRFENVTAGDISLSIFAPNHQNTDRKASLAPGQALDVGDIVVEPFHAEPGTVGAVLKYADGQLVVDWLVPDGPAQRAGVRVGDVILAVDGAGVSNISEASQKLRGAPGSAVLITLRRAGTDQTVPVNRAG